MGSGRGVLPADLYGSQGKKRTVFSCGCSGSPGALGVLALRVRARLLRAPAAGPARV